MLEAGDADWLRDYLSDPPAAATGGASAARTQPAPGAVTHGGNGAVVLAVIVAAALVALAVMAAMKKSPPMAAAAPASMTPMAPAYTPKRGADGKTHLHVVRSAPAQLPQVPLVATAPAADPPAAVQPAVSDYGIACAIQPQQASDRRALVRGPPDGASVAPRRRLCVEADGGARGPSRSSTRAMRA